MSTVATHSFTQELDLPFTLTQQELDSYQDTGYLKLKQVLSPRVLEHYRPMIHDLVEELSRDALPMGQRDT